MAAAAGMAASHRRAPPGGSGAVGSAMEPPAAAFAGMAIASAALLAVAVPDALAATAGHDVACLAQGQAASLMDDMSWAILCVSAFVAGHAVTRASERWAFTDHADWIDEMILLTNGSAIVYALTAAGVMDILPNPGETGLPARELARRCGLPGAGRADVLGRLLHTLAVLRLVEEEQWRDSNASGALYRHSERSRLLRQDAGSLVRSLALVQLSPIQIRPWWRIQEALESTRDLEPFRHEHGGAGVFDVYGEAANANAARHFDDLMQQLSGSGTASTGCVAGIAALPIWSEVAGSRKEPLVVDVGGGLGHVLAAVLKQHHGLQGVLFDRPDVISSSAIVPALRGELAGRTSFVGGSFFHYDGNLPGHADVFVLKWILHDWSDAKCRDVLRSIRSAIRAGNPGDSDWRPRLLLVEQVLPEETDTSEAAEMARHQLNDADMWVIYGGRERRVSEYCALLREESFATVCVTPLAGFQLVAVEAVPV